MCGRGKIVGILAQKSSVMPPEESREYVRRVFCVIFSPRDCPLAIARRKRRAAGTALEFRSPSTSTSECGYYPDGWFALMGMF